MLAAILLSSAVVGTHAQSINGRVRKDKLPLVFADISIYYDGILKAQDKTDSTGHFHLAANSSGQYTLTIKYAAHCDAFALSLFSNDCFFIFNVGETTYLEMTQWTVCPNNITFDFDPPGRKTFYRNEINQMP